MEANPCSKKLSLEDKIGKQKVEKGQGAGEGSEEYAFSWVQLHVQIGSKCAKDLMEKVRRKVMDGR